MLQDSSGHKTNIAYIILIHHKNQKYCVDHILVITNYLATKSKPQW